MFFLFPKNQLIFWKPYLLPPSKRRKAQKAALTPYSSRFFQVNIYNKYLRQEQVAELRITY